MARLRVLRVIYDLQTGGVQRQLLRVAAPLRELGVDLSVVCLRAEGEMASVFRSAGIDIYTVPFSARLDPIGLYKLRKLAVQGHFDLVHGQMYASALAATVAMIGTGVPVVNGYHSQTPFANGNQIRWARWCARRAGAVLAVSGAVQEPLLAAGISANRIRIVHNGVERPAEPPSPPPTTTPLRLVWIGRFVKQKRPHLGLEIMSELKNRGLDTRLTFVGEGPQFKSVTARAGELGLMDRVEFAGWQRDVRPFLRDAHLYMATSDREGFPNTLLEACAEGRGSILADIAPNREVLGGSDCARLIAGGASDWADAIASMTPPLAATMGLSAWERVEEFSIEAAARRTRDLYDHILGRAAK